MPKKAKDENKMQINLNNQDISKQAFDEKIKIPQDLSQ
jgi:hypothetical protein